MMEAERTSETLVNFYQTTRLYNPEDSHLQIGIVFYLWKQLFVTVLLSKACLPGNYKTAMDKRNRQNIVCEHIFSTVKKSAVLKGW
jgi:hypothetical protein